MLKHPELTCIVRKLEQLFEHIQTFREPLLHTTVEIYICAG